MKVGYARVSTGSQNIQMQIDALEKAKCEKIFQETESGANPNRSEMAACLRYLRKGDILVVWAVDRLARTKKEGDQILHYLKENNITLISLKENIDTSNHVGQLVLNILISVAESERERSIERTKAGLAAARARGKLGGRPHKIDFKMRKAIKLMYDSKQYSLAEIAKMYDVTKLTVYNYVKEFRNKKEV